MACCTKLFCPLFRVPDIRFSKCSERGVINGRNRLKFGIHASVSAFRQHRAAELLCIEQNIKKI